MSPFGIEAKKKLHCQELNTGKGYTGFFYFDNRSINTEICSYYEHFYLEPDTPIFLHTENNYIVSLYHNITEHPRENSHYKRVTYKQTIVSDLAVMGHDRWVEDFKIKRVTFLVKYTDEILKHEEKVSEIENKKFGDQYELNLLSEAVDGLTIHVDYQTSYDLTTRDTPTHIWPRIEIDFGHGITLFEYLEYVACLVQFFSLSLGVRMEPSDIRICRFSRNDTIDVIENIAYAGDYSVKQILWPETVVYSEDLRVIHSLVTARNDEELASLRECIIMWMQRHIDWKRANSQMMICLDSKHEISSDKLLAVCKWFEEIPLTRMENFITEEHINVISDTASKTAEQLGYGNIKNRITGALKSIKTETHKERFLRLLDMVRKKFGSYIIGDNMIKHLKSALDFRGKAAHGHLNLSDETEFRAFENSIYAMEALCFLLTACDLPINQAGLRRASFHPLIRDYQMMSDRP